MANRLKVAKVLSVKQLYGQGWSQRRIARELGISREAVARQVKEIAEAAPAAPLADDPNQAKAPTGSRSLCEQWRQVILDKLQQGLSAQRIFQDLVEQHGFEGKYPSVRRFVAKLNRTQPLPFRRMEVCAGEEAQIDFGTGAAIINEDGRRRRTHVLRVVLSHSRKGYSESVYRQTTEDFIRCLENSFRHFGGVPKTLVPDNLKAAVLKADPYDPELNPKLRSFCEHYGTVLLPTKPRTPRHKGKVERGVDYVQENALRGKTFGSLREQNDHLLRWETNVADTRIHGTTREQVLKVFQERERAALLPLPRDSFPCYQEAQRKVSRDGHVAVEKAYYSLPPEYLGHTVWARWDARVVRIFNEQMKPVCTHATQTPGRFSTLAEHLASEKIHPIERGTDWLLKKAANIGKNTENWSLGLVAQRGIEAIRVLHGLLNLIGKHPSAAIERACQTAHANGCYKLQPLRKLIQHAAAEQQSFDFLEEHPLIRNLSEYGDFVRVDFQKEVIQG